MELDGYSESPLILCEAWAHIGPPKSAQKFKVMTDASKLLFARSQMQRESKCILLFSDHNAASHFQGKSWMARYLHVSRIEVKVIEFPPELREQVLAAQKRQYR